MCMIKITSSVAKTAFGLFLKKTSAAVKFSLLTATARGAHNKDTKKSIGLKFGTD